MATSFKGWGSSWSNSWGAISVDPNAMTGAAGFALSATAQATATFFASGNTQLTFGAAAELTAIAQLSGTADITLGASGELLNGGSVIGDMSGSAAMTFSAIGVLTDPNAFKYPDNFEQGVAGRNKPAKDYLSENLLRQHKARDQKATGKYNLQLDDTLATELIVALVTEGFFDGDF